MELVEEGGNGSGQGNELQGLRVQVVCVSDVLREANADWAADGDRAMLMPGVICTCSDSSESRLLSAMSSVCHEGSCIERTETCVQSGERKRENGQCRQRVRR